VSIALKSHGMNVGVGGGTETVSQTMLAAAGLARDDRLAGMWIVMTDHAPHPFTEAAGKSSGPLCHALAFALVKASADLAGARLRVLPTGWTSPTDTLEIRSNPLRVADLTRSLAGLDGQNLRWQLDSGGWLEWQPDRARRILQPCEATPPSGSPV
jgi:hypothetical protein